MVKAKDFGKYETSWCPGCGNFGILNGLKKALAELDLPPHKALIVSGIGQAAKLPHYLDVNMFNGLHGRTLPVATGAKLVNPELTVIADSGDGCHLAEGGNHFIHAIRRNVDITILMHNNQVYGLTKGQASPTSDKGFPSKAQPLGAPSYPVNAVAIAVAMRAAFVARTLAGDMDHMVEVIKQAIQQRGTSYLEILQPCVSFNRINTWKWYRDRVEDRPEDYDPADWEEAMKTAALWGEHIPIGVIYKDHDKQVFEDNFPALEKGPLVDQELGKEKLKQIVESFA